MARCGGVLREVPDLDSLSQRAQLARGPLAERADHVPLLPAPSDTIAAPSKMAAATADPGAGSPQAGDSSGGGAGGGLPSPGEQELSRRLQRLYPAVNQHETPLPRSWSPKDKYNYIGLSQGNLRVHYKGMGLGEKGQRLCRTGGCVSQVLTP